MTSKIVMNRSGFCFALGLTCMSLGLASDGLAQAQNPNNPANHPSKPLPKLPPQPLRSNAWKSSFLGWRSGYTPYPSNSRRKPFTFRRYVLEFTDSDVIFLSPFYLYPNLPPFIGTSSGDFDGSPVGDSENASIATDLIPATAPVSTTDLAKPAVEGSSGDMDSDEAVQDLKHAWVSVDLEALKRLCPTSGKVKVSVSDQSYSLDPKDFLDLITDGVTGTITSKWSIMDLHSEDDEINLKILHTFSDPQGKSRSVYQTYKLEKSDSGFVIREFGSDPYTDPDRTPDGKVSSR